MRRTISRKYENLAYALLITALIASIVFFINSITKDQPYNFSVWIILLSVHYVALTAGIVFIILRLLFILKNHEHFLYILATVLNIGVGITNLVICLQVPGRPNSDIWVEMWYNLVVGAVSFIDIFMLNGNAKSKNA